MKALWVFLVVMALVPAHASQDLLPELVRQIKPSAVAIETFDSRGEKLSRGSGFFVDSDRIVTNRHVLDGAYRAEVHASNGAVFPVKGVLAVDAEGDVALVKIDPPTPPIKSLQLDKTSPQEGESVVVIGNPLGLEGSVTNGIVSAVRDIPTFGRIIQITAPISSGSSGSPVVNMQGQVIGIATLQITGGQSVNFAIPSERISQLHTAINEIRGTRAQIQELRKRFGTNERVQPALAEADEMEKKMSVVEQKLIQVNMKSSEGNLVFPNQLNEEFDTFSHVVEADAAPTQPQLEVFKVLSGRLDEQLTAWAQIKTDEVVKINRLIKQADLPAITVGSATEATPSPSDSAPAAMPSPSPAASASESPPPK